MTLNSRRLFLALACCMLLGSALWAQGYGGAYELDRAKNAMNRGEFRWALDQFNFVAGNYNFSADVRREAAYYVGFCCVKMSDPWGAIRAYESFIDRYHNGDARFVPDALYVLGRTYENVGRPEDAARMYRRCIDRFPYNGEFAAKSRERLSALGYDHGGDHGGGGHHGGGGYDGGVSYEVSQLIELAKMSNNPYEADQMLLKAARKARCGADYIAISAPSATTTPAASSSTSARPATSSPSCTRSALPIWPRPPATATPATSCC